MRLFKFLARLSLSLACLLLVLGVAHFIAQDTFLEVRSPTGEDRSNFFYSFWFVACLVAAALYDHTAKLTAPVPPARLVK